MATHALTTRRAVFAGAIIVAAAATTAAAIEHDDIEVLERERIRFSALANAADDEDEVARLADAADEFDKKIRLYPCRSKRGAILKLQSVSRGCGWGERFDAVDPGEVVDQVIAYLEAL